MIRHTPFCCDICGDVIGAYEPMTVLAKGNVRETSRAAERALPPVGTLLYHGQCYASRLEPPQPRARRTSGKVTAQY